MPTYNFKTGGDIETDGVVTKTIEGPAVLSPKTLAGVFYLRYLDGNDLYEYYNNTFEIDGVEFEGTVAEFCDAANALYESAGGGGEAYPDIDADTAITLGDSAALTIVATDRPMFEMVAGEAQHRTTIGDTETDDGYTSRVQVSYNESGSGVSLLATPDDEDTYASFSTYSNAGGTGAYMDYSGAVYNAVEVKDKGVKLTGIASYADNAAAITGGLTAGYLYRTGDDLKIVH